MTAKQMLKNHPARIILASLLAALILLYLTGPRPGAYTLGADLPVLPDALTDLEPLISSRESNLRLRPDNQSRLLWLDPDRKEPTPLAMLYLHGFSASWYEGEPLHRSLSQACGMNLYIPRLAAHGLETAQALKDLRPDTLYQSALDALAIARKIGKRVVIVGTSTGASLALMLAARHPENIAGLLLFSPNIRLKDAGARLLTRPWGLQLARLIKGTPFRETGEQDPFRSRYWYTRYRLEGVAALQQLLEDQMVPDTFQQVHCPVFLGYYYRDEAHQDPTVSVSAMLHMFDLLGTPASRKIRRAFPDAGVHVITNQTMCRAYDQVYAEALTFLKSVIRADSV